MRQRLSALSTRRSYRAASVALLAIILAIPEALITAGAPRLLAALVFQGAYVSLIILTYQRLRDAGLSWAWILLMVLVTNFGPAWHGFHLSNLLHLVPVALGWIVPKAVTPKAFSAVVKVG